MTEAFIKAAETKGHTVTRFDAAMKNLGGCHACETCYKTGKACSFDDDFNTLAPAILEADAVVFTMPVYWYSIPAQIKCVIDRLFSFVVGGKDISGKNCALITCCEEDDMSVMDGVRVPIERSAALMKWHMVGEVLIPGVLNPGDINKTDGCNQAAELANKI
ncbi:MAG: flavodoxin family protein [Lachnospiraceae bacterium]|nr:flavodoxin family protein [Lachnospiraceae bacterium]